MLAVPVIYLGDFYDLFRRWGRSPKPSIRKECALAWAKYETKIAFLDMPDSLLENMGKHQGRIKTGRPGGC